MIIRSLELKNFRNYQKLFLNFDQNINILYGNNAQGKTNVLEAVYVCATSKSHRGSRDREMIRFLSDDAHICMQIEKQKTVHKIDMHLKRTKAKGAAVDGIVLKRTGELFGVANVVFFSPEDLAIIKNGPAMRRRFIDMELCQLDKVYLHELTNYHKAVDQRNHLLRQLFTQPSLRDTLDVWDEQLVLYGSRLMKTRTSFISELNVIVGPIHDRLSGHQETLQMVYEPNVDDPSHFSRLLMEKRETDVRMKTTTVGPHRDDINFLINGIDIRRFGSQGQQRTAALSMKLAEIELVRNRILDTPVLLLDDVLSELDGSRRSYLLENISDIQTLITCTGLDEFVNSRFHINRIFHVENGTIQTMDKEILQGGTL